jgi:hypothetical protein
MENEKDLEKIEDGEQKIVTIDPKGIAVKQYKTMWNDEAMLATAFKASKYLSTSALVPPNYYGKPENCLIALDIANRCGLAPFTVCQQLYIVQGKPAWSGQMAIALTNTSGRFSPMRYKFVGIEGQDSYGCYAYALEYKTNEILKSTTITMGMAKAEGWEQKKGSKWQTMPTQMLQYRAGAFFARVFAPETLLGIPMVDEVKDTYGYEEKGKEKIVTKLNDSDFEIIPPKE